VADPAPTADALPAGSSPAVAADLTAAPPSDPLDALNETELHTWRMTGNLPDSSPVTTPPADSSPATSGTSPAASTDASAQPAGSDPAAPAPKGAEARIPELLRDRAREKERGDRLERELADLRRAHSQPSTDARPAASSAAPAGPVKPDPEKFTYGTADPAYLEALADYKVATTLAAERATWERGQREAAARAEGQRVISAFEQRAASAREKHADFDAVALLAPTDIPAGSAADLWVLEDDAGAEILYHLQQPANAGERKRILALSPREQLKELVRLCDRLTAAPSAAGTTNAPPPPPTLSTRSTPVDAAERAAAEDDMGTYSREMNARDLAARKR